MTGRIVASLLALLLAACDGQPPAGADGADLVFVGGAIWTADDAQPQVEAVAVRDGLIVFAGDDAGARQLVGTNTQLIDLGQAALFPGFTDAHAHLRGIGQRELTLNLDDVGSIESLKLKVAEAVGNASPGATIIGRGWIETHWPEARFPNREDIDQVSAGHPVILRRADGHALVANSMALTAAGITAETEAPFGGEIEMDFQGQPTGILIDNAMSLVSGLTTDPTVDEIERAYRVGGTVYNGLGWTGIHNMSVPLADVPLMEQLAVAGNLKLRIYNSVHGADPGILSYIDAGPRMAADGLVVTRAVKLYMDGALGSRGALLLAPYSDAEGAGLQVSQRADVMPVLEAALRLGWQVNTHAIGDGGNRMLLDWYGEAFAAVPVGEWANSEHRWRDEHTQIVAPEDIPRFAAMGVIPSMQPSHAIGDLYFAPDRLGPDRLAGAYAWRSLIDSGVVIAGGSDAPVEKGDPRIEFYAAVVRQGLDGFSNDDWNRDQRVSRAEGLKMFTLWPAYASFTEDRLGTIAVGKVADLSIFSKDLMSVRDEEILKAEALMTVVGGKVAYRADGF